MQDHHDAVWIPSPADLDELVPRDRRNRILVVNASSLDLSGVEVRIQKSTADMPAGISAFRDGDCWDVLIVGHAIGDIRSTLLIQAADDDPLVVAFRCFEDLWPKSALLDRGELLAPGTEVHPAGTEDVATVTGEPSVSAGEVVYRVRWDGESTQLSHDELIPVPVEVGPAEWVFGNPASVEDFTRALTVRKLTGRYSDTIYSFRSSRTIYRSYQFRPLLRLISSAAHRLLIADEVGLGKTIEAGLIWTELEHRTKLDRVLVVCPSGLRTKWVSEMRNRFDRQLTVLETRGQIEEMVEAFEEGGPSQLSAVVSVEAMREERLVQRLVESVPQFDLVIVDEAHVMRNVGTATNALGQVLADAADALIFLSATPLNLRTDDLFALLHLLDEDLFPDRSIFQQQLAPNGALHRIAVALRPGRVDIDSAREAMGVLSTLPAVASRSDFERLREIVLADDRLDQRGLAEARRLVAELNVLSGTVSRTRRADVATEFKARRVPREIHVDLTREEAGLHQKVADWVRTRAEVRTSVPGLASSMPLRQAASCLPVMKEKIAADAAVLNWDIDDFDGAVAEVGIPDADEWLLGQGGREILEELAGLGDQDSKFDALLEELRQLQALGYQQIMIFSFFRGTLGYLWGRLKGEFSARVMHGLVKPRDRDDLMQQFRDGDFDILLVSEVGSEGLDFEFCGAVINYDLPWNPMRVEQRIGRIDRFGQTREKLQISNFVVPGTVETDILYRLYKRIKVFEESIGELEPILRADLDEVENLILRSDLTESERQQELARIATAIETRELDIGELDEVKDNLTGIDNLLIDDFEQATLPRGAYIGRHEVENLTKDFVRRTGGTWRPQGDTVAIRGSAELAEKVERAISTRPAIRRHRSSKRLGSILRSEIPINLVLDSESGAHSSLELLGPAHPLVVTAAETPRQWRLNPDLAIWS